MCNLSDGLVEMGIRQGIEQGIEKGKKLGIAETNLAFAQMMLQDGEPLEKIQKYTGYSKEQIEIISKHIG